MIVGIYGDLRRCLSIAGTLMGLTNKLEFNCGEGEASLEFADYYFKLVSTSDFIKNSTMDKYTCICLDTSNRILAQEIIEHINKGEENANSSRRVSVRRAGKRRGK